ncbi:MAG: AAA family ATPase [Nanoarchaeota archaeon]|nr:AAA family ATPase [Nanoarchaeota archaeon]
MVIINRTREKRQIEKLGDWVWICGRRKTGKTFFVKNFINYDEYFFVNRDRTILRNNNKLSYHAFFELFKELIKTKRVVIDEFHRLPQEFFDYLHASKQGKLIAISSTLWFSKKLLGKGSPLVGLFSLMVFGLIDELDVINSLKNLKLDKKELVEAATYLREPIIAFNYKPKIRKWLALFLDANKLAINEIIGEIFSEEERRLSLTYEGILRAIASGKNGSSEISSYLFSRGLIKKDNPGLIQRYLDVLVKIGLIERVNVFNKKKFAYKNISPLFDLHFYLDEKYAYAENFVPCKFIKNVIDEKIPFHIENFFENLIAKKLGLKKVIIEDPQIDIALTRFKRLDLVAEVKWKNKITKKDLRTIEERLNKFDCRKLLIVIDKKRIRGVKLKGIQIVDINDLISKNL